MPGWMKWTVSMLVGVGVIVLGWRLSDTRWFWWVLPSFFIVNCIFLIVVVLLQSGKAADIAGAFGGAGSQTAFGPRGAATLLSRATTWCAVMFMICALALVLHADKTVGQSGSSILEKVSQSAPKKTPATPAPAPAAPTPQPNPPASQTPATQAPAPQSNPAPASQTPATQPATQTPAPSQPAKSAPAQPAPTQPAPAQTPPAQPKKP
jgi:preprotein translocase subunit SecG